MPFSKKPGRSERPDKSMKGRYTKKENYQPHGSDIYRSCNVVRHPTAVRRSDQMHASNPAGATAGNRSTRSLSVPSLHTTADARSKYSPPLSPPKPRSRSVRGSTAPAKKTLSFKKFKKLFGSHSELDEGGGGCLTNEHHVVGTYRPLNASRPRSIGGSSDCSNSSYAHSDFSRCNSLRDSSRSRISGTDSVFHIGGRQASLDANDYPPHPNHTPSGSTDSNARLHSTFYSTRTDMMPRSNSSASLKNFGVQTKVTIPDPRHFSIAVPPSNSTMVEGIDERGILHRKQPGRLLHRQGTSEDTESLWEDSQSFTYMNTPVVPSDPEYRQIAKELMSASPTRKNSNEFVVDPRRMSDASVDPRRVSNDSGVESSSAPKHNRSLPSTPITQTFTSVQPQNGRSSTPPEIRPTTPHGYLSQESDLSFPPGWDMAYTPQGLRYYIDHNTQSTHWKLPTDIDDSLGLPEGWEAVKSKQYGTYYVNHHNKTAIYQHPYHSRPPPPYHRPHNYEEEEPKLFRGDRRTPARSHSHRSTQTHRVLDPNASLPRRSKSFRDQETQDGAEGDVSHARQLSTMTFVPPSPYQIKEIPHWLRQFVEAPVNGDLDSKMEGQWRLQTLDDLTAYDTMIKRLFKKASEQVVKQYEYYRVAIQQETEERVRKQSRFTLNQQQQLSHHPQPKSPHTPRLHQQFNYPPPSHMPHPQPHPSYGGGVTSSGAYFDLPHPPHEHNNLHHPHPSSSPAMLSLSTSRHSSSNLQQHRMMGGGGGGVTSHHGNIDMRAGEGTPNRTQSYNNLPRIPSNGHMIPQQLHLNAPAGSTFADIFESNDAHFEDLEETFV